MIKLSTLLAVVGALSALLTLTGTAVGLVRALDQHLEADRAQEARIERLERVMLSEHPEYTLVLFPGGQ